MAVTEVELFRAYGTPPQPDRTVEGVVMLNLVEERIRELWGYRRWWRANRWADWPQERRDEDTELRALVALARHARRLAR